jgi:hypothetical protein
MLFNQTTITILEGSYGCLQLTTKLTKAWAKED